MNPVSYKLEYINQEYKDDLLKLLRGKVFHLTNKQAFKQILSDGFIFNNQNGRFNINTGSQKSFGRKKGWVCLFDLRDKNDNDIEETLEKYYFLMPSWFCEYEGDVVECNLVYLVLDSFYYEYLIPNDAAEKERIKTRKSQFYIPLAECWYPGDLPLSCICEIINVRIEEKLSPFAYDLHQLELQKKNKDQ